MSNSDSKNKLITIFDKHPEFIEMQFNTIKKHLKGEYEYIIFNNSKDNNNAIANQSECDRLGIKCIRIRSNYEGFKNNNSKIAADALNQAFSHFIDEKIFKIDSDMFLIGDVNIGDLLSHDLVYIPTYIPNLNELMWSGVFGLNLLEIDINLNFMPFYNGLYGDTFCQSQLLTNNSKYTKKHMELHSILYNEGELICMINNDCNLKFKGNELISNDRPNVYTADKYDISYERFNKYNELLKQYDFPEPPHVDFISLNGKEIIIHFKSANWTNYRDGYFNDKLNAMKNLIQ